MPRPVRFCVAASLTGLLFLYLQQTACSVRSRAKKLFLSRVNLPHPRFAGVRNRRIPMRGRDGRWRGLNPGSLLYAQQSVQRLIQASPSKCSFLVRQDPFIGSGGGTQQESFHVVSTIVIVLPP